jgi:hypothetical protein
MSVANELTSDVTVFVLKDGALHTSTQTRQLLIEFHSTLRKLTREERSQRLAKLTGKEFLSPKKAFKARN